MANIVGDEVFSWANVKSVFDEIENLEDPGYTDTKQRYVRVEKGAHGDAGPVHVEYAYRWENFLPDLLRGVEEHGWTINRDLNDGDPIGVGLAPASSRRGVRVTARSAYLSNVPHNLTIRAGVKVGRVLFEGKRAVGVESVEGETSKFCCKLVIRWDSRLMMHSSLRKKGGHFVCWRS